MFEGICVTREMVEQARDLINEKGDKEEEAVDKYTKLHIALSLLLVEEYAGIEPKGWQCVPILE